MERQLFFNRVVILMITIGGGLMICILGTVTAARAGKITPIIALPDRLHPGHPLPADATCKTTVMNSQPCHTYHVNHDGKEINLTADATGEKIAYAVFLAREYTIGDLILAWGVPSGFIQTGAAVDIYWGTRYVYLITCTLRPDSHVELIAYFSEVPQAPPWRGFKTNKNSRCAGGLRNP